MPIRKDWLQEQIDNAVKERELASKENRNDDEQKELGKVIAFREVMAELTKPPEQKSKQQIKKKATLDETYSKIVKYYMENPDFINNYPDMKMRLEKANAIAQSVVSQQNLKNEPENVIESS